MCVCVCSLCVHTCTSVSVNIICGILSDYVVHSFTLMHKYSTNMCKKHWTCAFVLRSGLMAYKNSLFERGWCQAETRDRHGRGRGRGSLTKQRGRSYSSTCGSVSWTGSRSIRQRRSTITLPSNKTSVDKLA